MAAFDNDDVSGNRQFANDLRPERGFPASVTSNASTWIVGSVIVVAIIVAFGYAGGWGSHRSAVTTPTIHWRTAQEVIDGAAAFQFRYTDAS